MVGNIFKKVSPAYRAVALKVDWDLYYGSFNVDIRANLQDHSSHY